MSNTVSMKELDELLALNPSWKFRRIMVLFGQHYRLYRNKETGKYWAFPQY